MTYATYEQASGIFTIWESRDDGIERCVYECTGYAGRGTSKNNPDRQFWKSIGPLPCGQYDVHDPVHHATLGPVAMRLTPSPFNKMGGRSGFWIHGDSHTNPGNASHGCIVLSRIHREAIDEAGVKSLRVVPGQKPPQAGPR